MFLLAPADTSNRGEKSSKSRPESPKPVVDAESVRGVRVGLDERRLQMVDRLEFQPANVPGNLAGLVRLNAILVNRDAAGYGWQIDTTLTVDETFDLGNRRPILHAADSRLAAVRIDLLTAVAHELDHLFGLEDLDPFDDPFGLMTGSLEQGVRRLPLLADIDAIFDNNAWEWFR